MGRRRSRRAEPGLAEEAGDLLTVVALSGPIGMIGVGVLFLIFGLWVRGDRQQFLPELSVWLGTALACGGGALALGGGIWAWVKWGRRPANRTAVTATPAGAAPDTSSRPAPRDGLAFERQVADVFRRQGYEVEETGTHGRAGDAGVDLVLRRPADPAAATVLVQCKDYAEWAVGAERVRAFGGAVAMRGPGHVGLIVTTSRFTADAARDAKTLGIRLIDGEQWTAMGQKAGIPAQAETLPGPAMADAAPRAADTTIPVCPRCRVPMVRREPRAGRDTWQPFWGCRNYPRCRQKAKFV
jgi:restriction system protein